jgi:uncharacterized MAPEG superfamily protein
MTTELTMLAWSAVLGLLLPNIGVAALSGVQGGIAWGFGNRDTTIGGMPPWGDRARRAHANLVENLVVFAALVLAAHAAGRTNEWTALGAQLFFWGRVGHAVTYIAGLVPWRTVAFAIAIVGEWIIAIQLLRG